MLIDKLTEDFYRVVSRTGVHPSILWVSLECYRDLAREREELSGVEAEKSGANPETFLGAEVRPTLMLNGVSWAFDVHDWSFRPLGVFPKNIKPETQPDE